MSLLLKEWEVAREVIAKADERTSNLRKYGFSFMTTLLTADAIGLHKLTSEAGGKPTEFLWGNRSRLGSDRVLNVAA
jgi:hypothetical protein